MPKLTKVAGFEWGTRFYIKGPIRGRAFSFSNQIMIVKSAVENG